MGNDVSTINVCVTATCEIEMKLFLNKITFNNPNLSTTYKQHKIVFQYIEMSRDGIEFYELYNPNILVVIMKNSNDTSDVYEMKNHLLEMQTIKKTPVCIVHNIDRADTSTTELSFDEKNEIFQIKNYSRVMTCDINYNNKENYRIVIHKILKWMINVNK